MEVLDESGNMSVTESQEVLFKPSFLPAINKFGAKANLAERHIELLWQPYSKVYNYVLYKAKDGGPLQAFKTLPPQSTNFVDRELYPNNKYRYAIRATLQSGAETRLSEVITVEF
jgi:hypothetical protein